MHDYRYGPLSGRFLTTDENDEEITLEIELLPNNDLTLSMYRSATPEEYIEATFNEQFIFTLRSWLNLIK